MVHTKSSLHGYGRKGLGVADICLPPSHRFRKSTKKYNVDT